MTRLHCRSPYGAVALARRIRLCLPNEGTVDNDNDVLTTATWGDIQFLVDPEMAIIGEDDYYPQPWL